ncbi:response regulator transcription factor [Streptomyces katrae]|uniref:Response regulator transcription factor n=1 Tax=Streptomyces katrae TaxID=68223 RepID=A0ABT7GRA6_9ACTN|nr:response regulator transcription factor [Streptomyces katrae]MDK9496117.1 response regulator transcription factor [Streptomyces katrae]
MIRVVVVDNEPLLRAGLTHVLQAEDDLVVTSAVPVTQAVATVRAQEPRVVLLDACTADAGPLADGFAAVAAPPAVCVVSRSMDPAHIATALAAGASAYLPKSAPPTTLAPVVRLLAGGFTVVSGDAVHVVRGRFADDRRLPLDHTPPPALTPREREVLDLLARGLTNREIAVRLHLAHGTIKDHVAALLSRLGATNRAHAAHIAHRTGLL